MKHEATPASLPLAPPPRAPATNQQPKCGRRPFLNSHSIKRSPLLSTQSNDRHRAEPTPHFLLLSFSGPLPHLHKWSFSPARIGFFFGSFWVSQCHHFEFETIIWLVFIFSFVNCLNFWFDFFGLKSDQFELVEGIGASCCLNELPLHRRCFGSLAWIEQVSWNYTE